MVRYKSKGPKCHSLAIQSSTAHIMDPQLTVNSQPILLIVNTSIKFLGMRTEVPCDLHASKHELNLFLDVVRSLVTHHQKFKLLKLAICPRLNWIMMIYKNPLSWIEIELDSMTSKFL